MKPTIPFTKEGYDKLLKERETLLSQRPEAVDHLKKAREMGDLSENGYYKASRQRLSFLDSRIRRVEGLIRSAKVVEKHPSEIIDIGSTVLIRDEQATYTYSIVGGFESDPSKQTISHKSPVGRALMGKKTGDAIDVPTPSGPKHYTIELVK